MAAPSSAVRGRFQAEPRQLDSSYVPFTRSFERNFDYSAADWPVMATPPPNGWARGEIIRGMQPQFAVTWFGSAMYDPSVRGTWRTEM